ncbi:MAG: response regulator transcription factor [Clostridia bacterium]|nr:response regulator transcription factor [Clostridia bacterium]MBQ9997766.1 response regulator transcription factor [Clostridia bacterium]
MEKTILIVDDEAPIVDILRINLKKNGYKVLEAYDGEAAVKIALGEDPDLILLDVMLPKMDGFTVCRKLRERINTPIVMITAREAEEDKVLGLAIGADDYITKPFSIKELLARVQANLRRGAKEYTYIDGDENDTSIKQGDLTLNIERFEVKKGGKLIDLTIREFELLKFLALQPEKIYSRETLMEKVWGYDYLGDLRTVDVTVRRLREKIEDNPSEPTYVITKRSMGYYFAKQK